jgi:hypothetical protein
MELKFARRRRAVDALPQADERHSDVLKVFEHRHQVTQIASEPVQSPAHEHIKTSPLGVPDQIIEGRAALLGAAHPLIDILLRDGPTARLHVSSQLQKLVLTGLVRGADPRVDGGSHSSPSALS